MNSKWTVTCFVLVILLKLVTTQEISNLTFPKSFFFGAATSAYQIEGAWNEDGKGPNQWDYLTHFTPITVDGSTGDVACDSYHRYKEDIAALKELGANFYRFSLSWSRLLPTGFANYVNPAGVEYYNNLIDGLLAEGIEPWVTLYHWDLPMPIHYLGGWNNEKIITYFTEYADLVFQLFGDRVKTWFTINEPISFCVLLTIGESRIYGENRVPLGIAEYLCGHNALRAHAKVYRLYQSKYKITQKGRVSLVVPTDFPLPASNTPEDKAAAQRKRDVEIGWFLDPLFYGKYPQSMIDNIANYSSLQGYRWSRLPDFTLLERLEIKGSFDFLSLNHYSSSLVVPDNNTDVGLPSYANDDGVTTYKDPSWPGTYTRVNPQGFREFLLYIKEKYGNPKIAITEQGYGDSQNVLNDSDRINYYRLHLNEVLKAIYEDGMNIIGYTAWSLLDNFEWNSGYIVKMGLYQVDFENENRTRTPKESARFYKNLIATRCLVDTCV